MDESDTEWLRLAADTAPAYPATNTTITRTPAWPAPFLGAIKDRDRARDAAVCLEQELAHVDQVARALAADLVEMHAATAIDLDRWPHAQALVDWATTDHDHDHDHDPAGIEEDPRP